MAPEYGATCGFFPVDAETIRYLKATGRKADRIALVEKYAKAQGMWRDKKTPDPVFTDSLSLDLDTVEPEPRRSEAPAGSRAAFAGRRPRSRARSPTRSAARATRAWSRCAAPITSSATAPSSSRRSPAAPTPPIPSVMLGAGLVARNAVQKGLKAKPWVKTSLAPGSQVVTDYLKNAGLNTYARQARLQPGRLWLHHLHRQFRSAAGSDRRCHREGRPGRRRGALRQPQLRRPRESRAARRTISPRRCWSWPMRWPAASRSM